VGDERGIYGGQRACREPGSRIEEGGAQRGGEQHEQAAQRQLKRCQATQQRGVACRVGRREGVGVDQPGEEPGMRRRTPGSGGALEASHVEVPAPLGDVIRDPDVVVLVSDQTERLGGLQRDQAQAAAEQQQRRQQRSPFPNARVNSRQRRCSSASSVGRRRRIALASAGFHLAGSSLEARLRR
jgi:hypothetical protein